MSAFDGYLRAPNRGFEVCCRGEWFRFRAHWWRKVYTSREIIQEVIRDRVLVRWEHGDFAFETGPVRGKEKWLAQTKTTARPPGSKRPYPTEGSGRSKVFWRIADKITGQGGGADRRGPPGG